MILRLAMLLFAAALAGCSYHIDCAMSSTCNPHITSSPVTSIMADAQIPVSALPGLP